MLFQSTVSDILTGHFMNYTLSVLSWNPPFTFRTDCSVSSLLCSRNQLLEAAIRRWDDVVIKVSKSSEKGCDF